MIYKDVVKLYFVRYSLGISNIVKDAPSSSNQFLTTESPSKEMKNAFYFTLKALLVLKTFKILSYIFGHVKKGLIRKIRLISKFMRSQRG